MPLSFTIVLEGKKEILYNPLDFKNGLTIDALVDSLDSAKAQNEIGGNKQQALDKIIKIDDPLVFQTQSANGQFQEPVATATLQFDFGDHIVCRTFHRNEESDRAHHGFAFHATR